MPCVCIASSTTGTSQLLSATGVPNYKTEEHKSVVNIVDGKFGIKSNRFFFVLMTVLLGRVLPNCFNCGKLCLIHCSKYESLRPCERNTVLILALYTCKLLLIKQGYILLS